MKPVRLSRRKVLRGLGGAGVALPLLQAMQDGRGRWFRSADAAPVPPPQRFVLFLLPNGGGAATFSNWTPKAQGTNYPLSRSLEPLGDLKNRVSVLTGLRHTGYFNFKEIGSGEHGKSTSSLLTGVQSSDTSAMATTLDQTLAKQWEGQTRISSIQAVCDPSNPVNDGDPRWTTPSWAGQGRPLPPIEDPATLFKRLFGTAPGGTTPVPVDNAAAERQARHRKSVLDYVRGDVESLKKVLGYEDKQRLGIHLDALRELEIQIKPVPGGTITPSASCAMPPAELSVTTAIDEKRIQAMVRLSALALECDLTRIVTLMYGYPYGTPNMPWLNLFGGDHEIAHTNNDELFLPWVRYKVQVFASFLRMLDAVNEGDRTLLGNSVVLGASDTGLGSHNSEAHTIMLAGTGGGLLRTGEHVVYPAGTPLNRLMLTLMQTLKMPGTKFGIDGNAPLTGLTA